MSVAEHGLGLFLLEHGQQAEVASFSTLCFFLWMVGGLILIGLSRRIIGTIALFSFLGLEQDVDLVCLVKALLL